LVTIASLSDPANEAKQTTEANQASIAQQSSFTHPRRDCWLKSSMQGGSISGSIMLRIGGTFLKIRPTQKLMAVLPVVHALFEFVQRGVAWLTTLVVRLQLHARHSGAMLPLSPLCWHLVQQPVCGVNQCDAQLTSS